MDGSARRRHELAVTWVRSAQEVRTAPAPSTTKGGPAGPPLCVVMLFGCAGCYQLPLDGQPPLVLPALVQLRVN